jgi:hypothetical protein
MALVVCHTWDGAPLPTPAAVVSVTSDLVVHVSAPFHGDPPPPGPPGPTWRLWEHEVVELFLLGDDAQYLEVELGPHGHHLVLQLHGVRQITAQELPLRYHTTIRDGRWTGQAQLQPSWLPAGPLRANAYAIHGAPGQRSYAAWSPVPGPEPDFHRLQHFRPIQW